MGADAAPSHAGEVRPQYADDCTLNLKVSFTCDVQNLDCCILLCPQHLVAFVAAGVQ